MPDQSATILGYSFRPKRPGYACGSASFLVAALHYLADALYKSLCHHRKLDDPDQAKKLALPYGHPRTSKVDEALVLFPPNDPQRGHAFEDRVKTLLRRHVVSTTRLRSATHTSAVGWTGCWTIL